MIWLLKVLGKMVRTVFCRPSTEYLTLVMGAATIAKTFFTWRREMDRDEWDRELHQLGGKRGN